MRDFSSVPLNGQRSISMTITEALHQATKGGYHIKASDGMDTVYAGANSEYSVWTRKDNDSSLHRPRGRLVP